jgi:hypothetical protein
MRADYHETAGKWYLILATCTFYKIDVDVEADIQMVVMHNDNTNYGNGWGFCRAPGHLTLTTFGLRGGVANAPQNVVASAQTPVGFANAESRTIAVFEMGT